MSLNYMPDNPDRFTNIFIATDVYDTPDTFGVKASHAFHWLGDIYFHKNDNWGHADVDDWQFLYDVLEHEIIHAVLYFMNSHKESSGFDNVFKAKAARIVPRHAFEVPTGWKP